MRSAGALIGGMVLHVLLNGCSSEVPVQGGSVADRPNPPASPAAAPADVIPFADLSSLPEPLRETAVAAYERAKAAPDDPRAVGEIGMLYLAHGFPRAAAGCFERSILLDPDRMDWHYYLALAQEGDGQVVSASKALDRAITLAPEYAPVLVRQARLLLESDPVRSESLARRAIEVSPESATAWFELGRAVRTLGRPEEALAAFRKALEFAPAYADGHYAVAMLLISRGEKDAAQDHLRKHTAGGPPPVTDDPLQERIAVMDESASALRDQAEGLARRGEGDLAIRLLEKSVELDVSGSTSLIHLGLVLARQGKFREAVERFEQALAADPASVEARSSLGLALMELGRVDGALQAFDEVLARHPEHAPSLIYKGRLLWRLGRRDEAIPLLQRGVASQPANGLYQFSLGEVLADGGRDAEAIGPLKKAADAMPSHPRTRYVLGVALARTGRLEEARTEWEHAIRLSPALAEAHLGLAGIALQQGDPATAVRHAERACELTGYRGRLHLETLERAYREAQRTADASRIRGLLENL